MLLRRDRQHAPLKRGDHQGYLKADERLLGGRRSIREPKTEEGLRTIDKHGKVGDPRWIDDHLRADQ